MEWVYLSPHLDDAVLSCGGLIWEQTRSGQAVHIWTICAGDPPAGELSPFALALHTRWQIGVQAAAERRREDQAACTRLGADFRHFDIPDCIYRFAPATEGDVETALQRHFYTDEQGLFGRVHPDEKLLRRKLANLLAAELPSTAQVICPLALGRHVDHQLVRQAAARLERQQGRRLGYYADYPYVLQQRRRLRRLESAGWQKQIYPVSPAGLLAWQEAIAAYASQISSFWPDLQEMNAAIERYWQENQGVALWFRPDKP